MMGYMMDVPLLLSRLIDYAAECHGDTEVIGRQVGGAIKRSNYRELRGAAAQLANALLSKGYGIDSKMGSIAWNTIDHVEVFYGVLGLGASLHTINPRLSHEHMIYMIKQVDDEVIFVDADTLKIAEAINDQLPSLKLWIYLDDDLQMPATSLTNIISRSEFIAGFASDIEWPEFDECQAATICYTSGTTGMPKGVVYSHRSITLSAMNMTMADMYEGCKSGDQEVVMPVAPIFHANGWVMPFTAPMNGHKLVLPGRDFSAKSLIELINSEGVTYAGAVPTVWMDIIGQLKKDEKFTALRSGLVAGARVPDQLFSLFDALGVGLFQTWGMTETPGCTRGTLPPGSNGLSSEKRDDLRKRTQGRMAFSAQHKILDEEGKNLPHDGVACGEMWVRGNNVASHYIGQTTDEKKDWLATGDIVRIFPDGSIEIVDRCKDVIKSGGEWISTPLLESAVSDHSMVDKVAVISIPHPRWQERPLMICQLKQGKEVLVEELQDHMREKVPSWWLPDDIIFIDEMPLTATGKIDKMALRRDITGSERIMVK